jgi:hypothetical protein
VRNARVRIVALVFNFRRFGSFLGLAALALQLVLSFGHVHRHDLVGPAGFSSAGAATTGQSAGQLSDDGADEYCAICASIFLASTSFVPEPPQLPLPILFEGIDCVIDVASVVVVEPRRAPFQSRAPPLA